MINQVIQNKIYNVYGKTGSGKTIMATFLLSLHKRIYANWEIRRKGKIVSNRFRSISELLNIQFSPIKGVIGVDEQGINNNSRRSGSDVALMFGELLVYSRKKNCNVVQISQLERMMDVYGRELSECSINMKSWFVGANSLMFEMTIYQGDHLVGSKNIDLFKWMKESGYSYNTLESGRLEIIDDKSKKVVDTLY